MAPPNIKSFVYTDSLPKYDTVAGNRCDGVASYIVFNGCYETVSYYVDSTTLEILSSISTIYPSYQGRYLSYWPNGNLSEKSSYNKGKKVGYSFYFNEDGSFIGFDYYDNDGNKVSKGVFNNLSKQIETFSGNHYR